MTMGRRNKFVFDKEGVAINIPGQSKKLKAVSLPIDIPTAAQEAAGLRIIRTLINVVLVDEDDPDTFLSEFDPPFELKVRYTADDFQQAQDLGGQLSLAVYINDEWMLLTKEKHRYQLLPDNNPAAGGFGVAQISNWGDPPVAWVI